MKKKRKKKKSENMLHEILRTECRLASYILGDVLVSTGERETETERE